MIQHLQDTHTLNNGVEMPGFGLGVYKIWDGDTATQAVKAAIKHGYRSIDTAAYYKNEEFVARGIKESGIPRDEIFLTTKVWNDDQGYESTLKAFEASLKKLDTDYLDLFLIHWPIGSKFKETWRAMERLYKEEKVRAIGVSNFHTYHLEDLMANSEVKPAVNQVEYHPHLAQLELKEFCESENIKLEAWSPLKRGALLDNHVLLKIAERHNKTVAQVILRWDVQNGVITIPKSVSEERIIENAAIFDFRLSEKEMESINQLNCNDRSGKNPEIYDQE